MKMIWRFVVVPAIPTETVSMRNGARFYCKTAPIGSTSMTTKRNYVLRLPTRPEKKLTLSASD